MKPALIVLVVFLVSGCGQNPQPDNAVSEKDVQSLIAQLSNEDKKMRADAAWKLKELGPKAEAAVPALTETLKDREVNVRIAAVYALTAIGSKAEPAVTELANLARNDPDTDVKRAAEKAIKTIKPESEQSSEGSK